jgi:ribosomal protein L40E
MSGSSRKQVIFVLVAASLLLIGPLCSIGTGRSNARDRNSPEVEGSPLFDRSLSNTVGELQGEQELWPAVYNTRNSNAHTGAPAGRSTIVNKTGIAAGLSEYYCSTMSSVNCCPTQGITICRVTCHDCNGGSDGGSGGDGGGLAAAAGVVGFLIVAGVVAFLIINHNKKSGGKTPGQPPVPPGMMQPPTTMQPPPTAPPPGTTQPPPATQAGPPVQQIPPVQPSTVMPAPSAPLGMRCSNCGIALPPNVAQCAKCGTLVAGAAVQQPGVVPPPAMQPPIVQQPPPPVAQPPAAMQPPPVTQPPPVQPPPVTQPPPAQPPPPPVPETQTAPPAAAGKCGNCGADLTPNSKFCRKCGTPAPGSA